MERHQTLRHTVQWSYDLLDDDERAVLGRCSVFAGGFDLAAASHLCGDRLDEYDGVGPVGLVGAQVAGHRRTGRRPCPLRHVGDDPPVRRGATRRHRLDRRRPGPSRPLLRRPGHRPLGHLGRAPPTRRGRLGRRRVRQPARRVPLGRRPRRPRHRRRHRRPHRPCLGYVLQRFEPVGWAEEILDAATAADVRQLPRLYTAASVCTETGRPDDAVGYARTAVALAADPRYDPFEPGSERSSGGCRASLRRTDGPVLRSSTPPWSGSPDWRTSSVWWGGSWRCPSSGRVDEARAIAEETVTAARAHGNPFWIAGSLDAFGRAFGDADPTRALDAMRQALAVARDHRVRGLGGDRVPRSRRPRSRPRRPWPRPRPVRNRHRLAPPSGGDVGNLADRLRRPRRLVRPPRTTRDRRHALRRQPTPRRHRLG